MPYDPPAQPKNFCGRIHFGPVCVNGGPNGEPICEWCKCRVSREEREQVQRQWNTVRAFLAPIKQAMANREKK